MSIDYTNLTTTYIADYIRKQHDNKDSRAAVTLGMLHPGKLNPSNYNLAGIAHAVATKAQEINSTPAHLQTTAERAQYERRCEQLLDQTIPSYFDPRH